MAVDSKPMSIPQWVFVVLAVGLSLWVLHVCVQIEVRNQLAERMLPRTEPDPWKPETVVSPVTWCLARAEETGETDLSPYLLTTEEQEQMHREVKENLARNRLRQWVAGAGLAQYAVAPIAILLVALATWLARKKWMNITGAALIAGNALAFILALWRNYYGSIYG